jgi:hypothetical protein
MALADRFLFSSAVPETQTSFVSSLSAYQRILFFAKAAVTDEVVFRLVLMTALVWLIAKLNGAIRSWCYWVAILVTAIIAYPLGHLVYLASLAPTILVAAREIALHGLAGIVWGYLYWRHGLLASIVGHVAAHLSLQPLLGIL